MPIDIRKYLTHICQVQKVPLSTFGDVTSPTSVYTLACFSYYGTSDRIVGNRQFTQRPGWTVVMPNSVTSLVAVGDVLANLITNRGEILVEQAKIGEITVYRHHLYGTQFVQLQLELN